MPGGDRTGPMGAGPMTGRGAGYCAGYNMPGYMNPVWGNNYARGGGFGRGFGRGFGMGYGRGRGFGRGYGMGQGAGWNAAPVQPYADPGYTAPPAVPQNELAYLKEQAKYFGDALENINKRIAKLENQKEGI